MMTVIAIPAFAPELIPFLLSWALVSVDSSTCILVKPASLNIPDFIPLYISERMCNIYVCICMYVCIYVCMYVYMYVCMYICTYVCMYVCIYVRTYICCMCVCVCVRVYVCVCVCVCVCVFVYSHVCCKCMYVVDTSFSHQLLTSMALLMASAGITPDSLMT